MPHDIFEQLAKADVPPVPSRLDVQFRKRLNAILLMTHLFDFTFRALPQTAFYFLASIVHLIVLTAGGELKSDDQDSASPKQP